MTDLALRAIRKIKTDGISEFVSAAENRVIMSYHKLRGQYLPLKRVDVQGVALDISRLDISAGMYERLGRGVYESNEAKAIDSFFNSEEDVIDLGGCLGFTACYLNKDLNSSCKHIVVEPNPNLIPTIKDNRELNNCNFKVINTAYSSDENIVTLEIPDSIYGASLNRSGKPNKNIESVIEISSVNIESLLDDFDITRFQLVADIEGQEFDLLSNELDILEKYCSTMVIEYHPESYCGNNIKKHISSSDFELVSGSVEDVAVYKNTEI